MRFAATSVLRFISDFYLESTNKQGGAFQNLPYGDNGLRHVMTGEVSRCHLTIGLPHGCARIPSYQFPCNELLFNLKGPYHICASLTSCSASHLSRIFRHWMRLCSRMKSSPSGCAATPPSTPIIQHVAGWDNNFGVQQPGLLVVRGWNCFTMFAEPRVRPWLY